MRAFSSVAAIAILLLVPFAAHGESQTSDEAFVQRLYAGTPGKTKTYACFMRKYDSAHLAQHPRQKVRAMKLLVTAEWIPEDTRLNHSFDLALRYRNRRGLFDSSGECGHAQPETANDNNEPSLSCSVDCDGGGFGIVLSKDDKSVMLRLSRVRVWRGREPDEAASEALEGGADDNVFRLERADLNLCRSMIRDRKELAALRSK